MRHTGEKPHKCSYCCRSLNFSTSTEKKGHKMRHTWETSHKCIAIAVSHLFPSRRKCIKSWIILGIYIEGSLAQCTNTAFQKRPLNKQKQTIIGGKPECPRKNLPKQVWSGNQVDIQRQDEIHTEEKPHKCACYCSKSLITSSNKKRHEMRHHRTGEKPHTCSYCSKSFVTTTEKEFTKWDIQERNLTM